MGTLPTTTTPMAPTTTGDDDDEDENNHDRDHDHDHDHDEDDDDDHDKDDDKFLNSWFYSNSWVLLPNDVTVLESCFLVGAGWGKTQSGILLHEGSCFLMKSC